MFKIDIPQLFASLHKKRPLPDQFDEDEREPEPEKQQNCDNLSVELTNSSSTRTPLAPVRQTSSRNNASPPAKRRRVLKCVQIPVKRKPTRSRSTQTLDGFSLQTPTRPSIPDVTTYTRKGRHVPAWKRLGLELKHNQQQQHYNTQQHNSARDETRDMVVNNRQHEILDAPSDTNLDLRNSSIDVAGPFQAGKESLNEEDRLVSNVITAPKHQQPRKRISSQEPDTSQPKGGNATGRTGRLLKQVRIERPQRSGKRVSYVDESIPRDWSDAEDPIKYDDHISIVSVTSEYAASEVEGSIAESDDDVTSQPLIATDDDAKSIEVGSDIESEEIRNPFPVGKPRTAKKAGAANPTTKANKIIDMNLPPLSNIEDIVMDMATKACGLGLDEAVADLKDRPLHVATMCSGTESPLIFLELLSKALGEAGKSGFQVQHHFSAEIDIVKQAYIERNFRPKILFTDVRDFIGADATTATTAYGAKVPIPGELDIVIAGFVCKDLSRLNSRPKGLEDDGETGDTWLAVHSYAKSFKPSIVLIENVASTRTFWDTFEDRWAEIGYESEWLYCDTKNYYIPQTRKRMYMIAINRNHYGKNVKNAVARWKDIMGKLRRQCSSPFEAFISDDHSEQYAFAFRTKDPSWDLCRLRYDRIRSEEQLGTRRPVSQWSEIGTVRPPDHANRKWYHSQVARVWDAIDIAHLQGSRAGHDTLYKMQVWDVSQNVDRFNSPMGIVPCITPNGCDFVSNRQTALSGSQLLLLQGMPYGKLLFGRETQKDRQDLAGNAMTLTVIGASIISALICGRQAFRIATETRADATNIQEQPRAKLLVPKSTSEYNLLSLDNGLDLRKFMQDARESARKCVCEGTRHISKSPIKVCESCDHTACSACAGHPRHFYKDTTLSALRKNPIDFEREWRPRLPARMKIVEFPDLESSVPGMSKVARDHWRNLCRRLAEARNTFHSFSIGKFQRLDNSWKVQYVSPLATLELCVGDELEWRLYLKCPGSQPGNSPLRKALEHPLALGSISKSLLTPKWNIYVPQHDSSTISISARSQRTSSWRCRLGLPDYKTETVPLVLDVKSEKKDITGSYTLLPNCGTAMSSLYRKSNDTTPMFFFLESDPLGHGLLDSFIFSQDCRRLPYGEHRLSLARLSPSWRPWKVEKGSEQVHAFIPGYWIPAIVGLSTEFAPVGARIPSSPAVVSTYCWEGCSAAVSMLDVRSPIDVDVSEFSAYSCVLEQAKLLPVFSKWNVIDAECLGATCACAPSLPPIYWSVDARGVATAHEDRKAAALFERATKRRNPVFDIRASSSSSNTHIQVGVNIASLVHRAKRRLGTLNASRTAWRLITDHVEPAWDPFVTFSLKSNSKDIPFAGPIHLKYPLSDAQSRSLGWMREQECGKRLLVSEIEEEIHAGLGWRAEARAETEFTVRGGVLADLPSFGKTVTTIGLIQSELEVNSNLNICEKNQQSPSHELPALIELAATLIVCPYHLTKQWNDELKTFMGEEQYEKSNVLVITKFDQLERLTISAVQASQIIIVSWNVLAQESYTASLAQFAAMPEPVSLKGRGYDAWLEYAVGDLPTKIQELKEKGIAIFREDAETVLSSRLEDPKFGAVAPLKLRHGRAYVSHSSMITGVQNKNTVKSLPRKKETLIRRSAAATEVDWQSFSVPLLHMFRFNRVVIDEYHYLFNGEPMSSTAYAALKKVSAHKRWLLSGTPPLSNFSDVNCIASLLGITLGRYTVGNGPATTKFEKRVTEDQTNVEKFLSRSEVMSSHWHKSRNQQAQAFLDQFVRQNEPSLKHIACTEILQLVKLPVAHNAIYLEHSQHLIAQNMQIKKAKDSKSDRIGRLNASLNNSASAEDALIKSALSFRTTDGTCGMDAVLQKRAHQIQQTERELLNCLIDAEKLQKQRKTPEEHYAGFKRDISNGHVLGDGGASLIVRDLIAKAVRGSGRMTTATTKKVITDQLSSERLKTSTSSLRSLSQELTLRLRSLRFLMSIKEYLPSLARPDTIQNCSSPTCIGTSTISQFLLASDCGHMLCETCLEARIDDESCVHADCDAPVLASGLIKGVHLGFAQAETATESFGSKLDAVVKLIHNIPEEDQALIFVPNEDCISVVEEVLEYHAIRFNSLGNAKDAAEKIEDFKENTDSKKMKKVLLLNLVDESASGINLVNANHVIFVSPLLAESQYSFDSAMAQAIARSRRYRQEKEVHIYHFAALRTIDVDILEHRHRRCNMIGEHDAKYNLQQRKGTKEKTRLIRTCQGLSLVPLSWLTDNEICDQLGIDTTNLGCYTSLLKSIETFRNDGE